MNRKSALAISGLLLLTTLIVYADVASLPFIGYDDQTYVVENEHVRAGLSGRGLVWAFSSYRASNWHPLTWLSHMLDVELFGMDAGRHHAVNVALHAVNAVLLLWLLLRLTGALWPSAFVAAAFAVHPMHVESVAWIAERKDVLAALLGLLSLLAYASYARRPGALRYISVALCFALGLLAKPMLVTLPFVMLLLDVWPLRRWQPFGADSIGMPASAGVAARPLRLGLEKLPLLVLAAGSCAITYLAQLQGGSVSTLEAIPFDVRLENALVAYLSYAGKLTWPTGLAVLYPHRAQASFAGTAIAGLALVAATAALLGVASRRRPAALVGWLWYLGMLVPVIGLVQVGMQGMADRYTYLPSIGLFLAAAFGLPALVRSAIGKRALGAGALALLLIWCVLSVKQLEHWRSTVALFTHAASVTQDNYVAHNKLGRAFRMQGQLGDAAHHYAEALRIKPDLSHAAMNLGVVRAAQGRFAEAESSLRDALRLDSSLAPAYANLGYVRLKTGRRDEAIALFEQAIGLDSGDPLLAPAYANLSTLRYQDGRPTEGRALLERAVELAPSRAGYRYRLGVAFREEGRADDARAQLERALVFDPDHGDARRALEGLDGAR